jgi:hypothetical protein
MFEVELLSRALMKLASSSKYVQQVSHQGIFGNISEEWITKNLFVFGLGLKIASKGIRFPWKALLKLAGSSK